MRFAQERPRQRCALFLATGQRGRPCLRLVTQAHVIQKSVRRRCGLPVRQPQRQVVDDRQPRQQPGVLKQHRNVALHTGHASALCMGVQASQGPEQGGFSAARLSEQCDKLARRNVQINRIQHVLALKATAEPAQMHTPQLRWQCLQCAHDPSALR